MIRDDWEEMIGRCLDRRPPSREGYASTPAIPDTFEDWLKQQGMPASYGDLFNRPREALIREYQRTFHRIELLSTSNEALKEMFERFRQLRFSYIEIHGIERWSVLQEPEDAHHLEWKDELFRRIESVVTKIRAQKVEIRLLERQHKLVTSLLFGVHPNYESMVRSSRRTWHHQFDWSAKTLRKMFVERFGLPKEPLRMSSFFDPKWTRLPRIDWHAESEEEELNILD